MKKWSKHTEPKPRPQSSAYWIIPFPLLLAVSWELFSRLVPLTNPADIAWEAQEREHEIRCLQDRRLHLALQEAWLDQEQASWQGEGQWIILYMIFTETGFFCPQHISVLNIKNWTNPNWKILSNFKIVSSQKTQNSGSSSTHFFPPINQSINHSVNQLADRWTYYKSYLYGLFAGKSCVERSFDWVTDWLIDCSRFCFRGPAERPD